MLIERELLNPKNDYVFKRIFGYKGNENITKQMLTTILKTQIDTIELDQNPILEKDLMEDKVGIVDKLKEIKRFYTKWQIKEEGLQQGLQQGKKQKAIEIAKNMLKMQIDIKLIVEATGLTKEEIENLK